MSVAIAQSKIQTRPISIRPDLIQSKMKLIFGLGLRRRRTERELRAETTKNIRTERRVRERECDAEQEERLERERESDEEQRERRERY